MFIFMQIRIWTLTSHRRDFTSSKPLRPTYQLTGSRLHSYKTEPACAASSLLPHTSQYFLLCCLTNLPLFPSSVPHTCLNISFLSASHLSTFPSQNVVQRNVLFTMRPLHTRAQKAKSICECTRKAAVIKSFQWVTGGPLTPNTVKVKNACSYTATPPYIFMAWGLIKHRESFTFYFTFTVASSQNKIRNSLYPVPNVTLNGDVRSFPSRSRSGCLTFRVGMHI
jgi:hypothetical protein